MVIFTFLFLIFSCWMRFNTIEAFPAGIATME